MTQRDLEADDYEPDCAACGGTGYIDEPACTTGPSQHSACRYRCDECDGKGTVPAAPQQPAPGAPEGWPEIAHPHRPPSAFTERAYLRRQIERVGEETAVVGTLCTTAMASDSRGSLSGYLWAIAEWAQGQIAKTSDAALTSSSAKPGGEKDVLAEIAAERQRQIKVKGWTPEHDDGHVNGEIANAAADYAQPAQYAQKFSWAWKGKHPDSPSRKPRRQQLVIAGALVVAEIERLDRAALKDNGHG